MAAPELRLNVTLDLASFRSQLGKLAQTAAAYYYPVNLIIDKKNFEAQLKALGKIKPVINIKDDQLIAAKTRIGTLNKSLATLRRATATPIEIKVKYVEQGKPSTGTISKSGTFRQRLTGLDTEPIKQLYAAAGKAGIVQFDAEIAKNKGKIITALNQAGESSVTGLLNGLKSKDSAVKTAAKSLGDILIAALKLSLQIQSPSKRTEAIGEDAGEGFNKGLKESLSEAKDSAVSKMRELVAALRIEAAKIQNISLAPGSLRGASAPASLRGAPRGGRGYFNSIGPLPEGSKEPYTMTDRGYQPYLGGPGVGSSAAPRGLLSPASAIGRGSRGQSFAGAPINFSMGAFPQLPPSGTANQLRQQARVAQAHLRSAERSVAVFGERAAMLDKAMSAFRTSGRATGYTSPIGPLPRDSAEPYAAGSRGMFGKEGFEARLESRPIAGLLSPSSTPTREQIVAMREKIARQRSDARALDVQLEDRLRPTVPPRQYFQPNTQPLLPGSGGALARSSAIVPYGALALRGGGGGLPPGGGGGGAPPTPPSGGGRGGGFFGGMQFNMPKLPGAGIVQGLGTEFGFAAKQVLLFGTAYKALAFLTDFPSKVGAAVGQLQSFRNTLNAISPTAADAAASNQLILDTVGKYNTPIQSARDGFTKLYASMEPAGFSGKQIGDLFLGISKASATLGLSSDKVDRVTYAFSQMASKGQLMSEEVSGQLGDVIPGALSIMAKAANMDIKTFKKAMEDGMFVGKAFEAVMSNVPIVLEERFGKGAEGAAKTFQGALNNMQTSLTLLYEAFEPVAVGFLNAVVTPMTSGIKTLTDGFNAFFTGAATKTSGGFAIAQELEKLRPTFEGLRTNAVELIKVFGALANTVLTVGKLFLQLASNPFVGYLAKIAIIILPLNAALGGMIGILTVMRGIWAANAIQLLLFNRGLVTGNITLSAFKAQMKATGATAAVTSASIRTAGITLRTFFASTGVGLVLVGISLLIERFLTMNQALADSKEKALGAAQAIRSMSQTEARQAENQASRDIKTLQQLEKRAKKGEPIVKITQEEKAVLQRSGVSTGLFNPDFGKAARLFPEGPLSGLDGKSLGVEVSSLAGALQQADSRAKEAAYRIRTVKFEEQQVLTPPALQAIPDGGGEDDKAAQKEAERRAKLEDKLANRRDQLEVDAANRRAALDQTSFDSRLRMSEAEYDHKRALQDTYFEREMSGLDSIEARQKKFQQDLKAIEDRRIDSIRKAELDAVKAVQDLRTASIKATAVTGGTPGGAYLQGNIGPTSTGPHFDVKKQGGGFFPRNYLDPYVAVNGAPLSTGTTVPGGTFAAHQARGSHGWDYAFGAGRHAATLKGGAEWMGGVPTAHGEKREFKIPTGEIFSFLHGGSEGINARPISAATRPGAFAMGRREDKAKGQLAVEQEDAQNKALEKLETIRRANNLALEQTITLVKQNIDSIFPVKEQQLENDLLELRNKLELKGTSKEIVDMEVQKAKATKEYTYALEKLNGELDANKRNLKALEGKSIKTETDKIEIGRLKELIAGLNKEIAKTPELQKRFDEALAKGVDITKRQKEIEKVKALVGDFVSDTSSKYKGFLKAVISGEDAADALRKFQEGLTDKVLTIFLDFAMAPVEDMMKKSLEGLFMPKVKVDEVPVTANTNELTKNTNATIANTSAITGKIQVQPYDPTKNLPGIPDFNKNAFNISPESAFAGFDTERMFTGLDTENMFVGLNDQIKASLDSVSLSFTDAAFNLNTSAEPWKQTLITDIPFALSSSNEQIATQGTSFSEGLTNVVGGIGAAAAGITGIFAGISQIGKGGTSNVLGGIGSILMGAGGAMGGLGKIFGFADGGIPPMNKPSLVGERGPELFVPHSMGTIVPADATAAAMARYQRQGSGSSAGSSSDTMGASAAVTPVLSMSFETTRFLGQDYVSTDQLQAAMMATEKRAAAAGAKAGAAQITNKLQQSPSYRRQVGLR